MTKPQRRWMRLVMMLSFVLPVFIVVVFLAAVSLMDFNPYKPVLEQEVLDRTGLKLTIKGDINVAVYPFGLTAEEVILASPAGYQSDNMATATFASMQVSLWDLFVNKAVTIVSIELINLDLSLEVNKTGVPNWKGLQSLAYFLTGKLDVVNNAFASEPSSAGFKRVLLVSNEVPLNELKTDENTAIFPQNNLAWSLESLVIQNGSVEWIDNYTEKHLSVKNIQLSAFDILPNASFKVFVEGDYENHKDPVKMSVNVSTDMSVEEALTQIQFDDWRGFVRLNLPNELNVPEMRIDSSGSSILLNLKDGLIHVHKGLFRAMDTLILMDVEGSLGEQGILKGRVSAEHISIPTWIRHTGVSGYEFVNQLALNDLSTKFTFSVEPENLAINDLVLDLDGSIVTGHFWRKGVVNPKYRFNFNVDKLNMDAYQMVALETKQSTAALTRSSPLPALSLFKSSINENELSGIKDEDEDTLDFDEAGRPVVVATLSESYLPLALPIDMLQTLNVRGQVSIDAFQIWNQHYQQVDATLTADKGLLSLAPLDAQLYGGQLRSKLKLNVNHDTPQYQWRGKVKGVQLAPFLTDGWQYEKLTGDYDGFFNFKSQGVNDYLLKQNLNGSFSAKIKDGDFVGIKMEKLFKGRVSKKADKTPFKQLEMKGTLRDGIYQLSTFEVTGEQYRASGRGKVDLNAAKLVGSISVMVNNPSRAMARFKNKRVPVLVTGSLQNLKWEIKK